MVGRYKGIDRTELAWDVEGTRGPCGLEKAWTGLSWHETLREQEGRVAWRKHGQDWASMRRWGSKRAVWPGDSMDRTELAWDVEGTRGPCGLEKAWTGLSWHEMLREQEGRVAWREHGQDWVGMRRWGSKRAMCPGESMDRTELAWDVEGARGPCVLEKACQSCWPQWTE